MAKIYNYLIISVGLTFLLKFAGIPSGADSLISWLGLTGDPSGVSLGTFFMGVGALFAVGTGSGIAISFFTKSSSETYVIAPICLGIFTVITSTFISLVNYTKDMGFVFYIVFLMFVPSLIGFAAAIISFWRGSDA